MKVCSHAVQICSVYDPNWQQIVHGAMIDSSSCLQNLCATLFRKINNDYVLKLSICPSDKSCNKITHMMSNNFDIGAKLRSHIEIF